MRKIIFTILFVYVFFITEFLLFNLAGRWLLPNLLLLLIIYFNLAFGIRYSIFTAVLAGILKDSYAAGIFGFNIFAFVLCAYLTTGLKRYLHYVASRRSRLLLVFIVTAFHFAVLLGLHVMSAKVDLFQSVVYVFVPEMILTLAITSFTFNQLRKCVLKLFA